MTTLAELNERLEKAEGPDRELDADIAVELDFVASREWWSTDYIKHGMIQGFTGSIDAAVALTDRVLKIYRLDLTMDPSGVSAKVIWWPAGLTETENQIKAEGMGWTPATSICLATLKALEATR